MDTATLVGRVFNVSGQMVVGARVELVDIERNTKNFAQTNHSGVYAFPNTKPGHYRVTVSAPGYRTAILASLTIYVQDDLQQNFRMMPGPPLESVTMQANGTPTETTGAVGTVVEQTLVSDLPLNGRSFQTLFQLTPGVVIAPTTFASQGQFSVNGQRTNTNYFIIDGVSANFGIAAGMNPGQSAGGSLPALTAFGGTNSLVSTDDVQEFAVLTSSYSAEFGRTPGGQVSIVTRSGTKDFHGQIFDYLRNDAFDANDWFANRENLRRAALRQNDYGGTLGGPLLRNATFFFLSYEGMQLRQPSSEQTDVPSISVRNLAPVALQPILNAYPVPTGQDEGNGLSPAAYSFSNPSTLNTASIRIDEHVHEAISIFARYDYSVSELRGRGAALNSLSTVSDTRFNLETFTSGVSYKFSSLSINDLRFNWSKSSASSADHLDSFGGASPVSPGLVLPPSIPAQDSLFQFVVAPNAQQGQLSLGRNVANSQTEINVVDSVSHEVGTQLLKAGVDFRKLLPTIRPATYVQQDIFGSVPTDVESNVSLAVIGSFVAVNSEFSDYSAYIQDTWRPTTRLSINSGLRWDYNPPPNGRGSNGELPIVVRGIQNLATLSLKASGATLYGTSLNNFAPRFGAAYEVQSSAGTETVIKAGAGMFYDLANVTASKALEPITSPFSAQKALFGVPFPLQPSDAEAPALGAFSGPFSTIVAFPPKLNLPRTWQWNLSVEQSLGRQQQLGISYVGALGSQLLRTETFIGDQAGLTANIAALSFTSNTAYSSYHSLQVQFQRRFTTGAHVIALYGLSHSLDNVSTDAVSNGIPARFIDPHTDYGPSDFDIRHTAALGINYAFRTSKKLNFWNQLIANWTCDSILMTRSSPPVNVVISRDIGFGTHDFRPDLLNGVPLYLHDQSFPGGRVINPAALSIPDEPRQGTLGRNYFRGFPFIQTDFSLRRHFRLSDRLSLQSRIEVFNLLNRANFAPPSGEFGSVDPAGKFTLGNGFGISHSTFGQGLQSGTFGGFGSGFSPLYQVGSARSLQFVLKVEF